MSLVKSERWLLNPGGREAPLVLTRAQHFSRPVREFGDLMHRNIDETSTPGRVHPSAVANALESSIQNDLCTTGFDPENADDLRTLAHWAGRCGYFEAEIRAGKDPDPRPRIPIPEVARWLRLNVSPHPERFREVVEALRTVEANFLRAEVKRLMSCGTVWRQQLVVKVYWLDRKNRERLRRQIGIHRCKHAWCPTCGRSRQAQFTSEIEKILILARDFGFHEGHGRLLTLTVPNGKDIRELRDQAHTAFAKLQRTRWWNRQVFGWVRGSEVVTGKDGNWNLHLHLLVVFWSPKLSYQELGRMWTQELGGPRENGRGYVVDFERLEAKRWTRKDGGDGSLKRRGGLIQAARYITKYLTKAEELRNLELGPGGLAHLVGSTKGLRRFSVGGGCAVLRRAAKVLIPSRSFQAEEALAGTYLHEGRRPWRVEEVNPETGEVRDVSPGRLMDERQRALERWGEILETNPVPTHGQALPGRVVGVPCGPRGRYRRVGAMPLSGPSPTVEAFERSSASPLIGVRALLGPWKVFRWQEKSIKTERILRFAAVLPATRYSWKATQVAIRTELALAMNGWDALRRKADREASRFLLDPLAQLDAYRSLQGNLPREKDRVLSEVKVACDSVREKIQEMAYERIAEGNPSASLERLLYLVRRPKEFMDTIAFDQRVAPSSLPSPGMVLPRLIQVREGESHLC